MSQSSTPPLRRRDRRALERRDRPSDRRRTSTAPAARRSGPSPFALVSIAAVLVAAVVIVLNLPKGPSAELVTPPTAYSADLTDGEILGRAEAPVVIELYADFQCPYCARLAKNLLPLVVNEFVTAGIVRVEAHDIDIVDRAGSTESLNLAVAGACAADQDRYWQFHDLVFWNQGRENRGDHDATFITRVADAAGLDRTAFDACIAETERATAVETATATAFALGIRSTPTIRINGQLITGIPEYAELASLIRGLASPSPSPEVSAPASSAP